MAAVAEKKKEIDFTSGKGKGFFPLAAKKTPIRRKICGK
jgi:hypothetical protein